MKQKTAFICKTRSLKLTDEKIWSEFKKGNMNAFEMLYKRYFNILLINGLRVNGEKAFIMDCIQDLFTEMWLNRFNLAYPDSVKAYLISSLRRKVVRQMQRAIAREERLYKIERNEFDLSMEEYIIHENDREQNTSNIQRAIQLLTRRQKEAVFMRFYSNLSYTEMSLIMQISVESIYNLISQAVDCLQKELRKTTVV